MVGACSGRSAWRWRNCSPGCPTAPDRARRGRHLPCTPLTGVTFCEGAPPARGGTADGARALGPVLARLVAHAGRAILSIGDERDRLLDRCCRRPGCWLRVLPVAAGCSRWFAFRQVETQLDLRRAASPGYLHLHRITADDVAAILGDPTRDGPSAAPRWSCAPSRRDDRECHSGRCRPAVLPRHLLQNRHGMRNRRRLALVHVCHDGHVAQVVPGGQGRRRCGHGEASVLIRVGYGKVNRDDPPSAFTPAGITRA
jgi:hypothetical protein